MGKLKIVLVSLLMAAVLFMAACFFCKPLYYRLYLGDRITGSIKVSVDGVPLILDESSFSSTLPMKITVNEFDTSVALKGGEYGSYGFDVNIQGVNNPLEVHIHHFNWWSVTEFQINAEVSTEGNIVSVSSVYTTIDDKGEEVIGNCNDNFDADTDEMIISLGGA